jgi:hypothetical protein
MKPKTCPKCNKVFIPNKRKQKYCSHKCSVKKGWSFYGGYVYAKSFKKC